MITNETAIDRSIQSMAVLTLQIYCSVKAMAVFCLFRLS